MKEIIHIVGLNNEYKKDFILKIHQIDPNYNIIDIDDITQKINSSPKIAKLYDEYEKVKMDNFDYSYKQDPSAEDFFIAQKQDLDNPKDFLSRMTKKFNINIF